MTTTDDHPSVFAAGREKARAKLRELLGTLVAETVADQISDAVLNEALPLIAANRLTEPSAEGYGQPVHWATYNALHKRALRAEHALEAASAKSPA
ncbi:hypothetical protein PV516_19175 [Streptomyces scabiei]|uniref:hypothetical protein n=1 Tax=Streptomyces scabiei TaxID=1930 RepID=UPI0029A29BCD|nr:hypothetical protein [Streptomyces scabiei]MDX3165911.1 hypothetical protein [Streptomyces scabiei]